MLTHSQIWTALDTLAETNGMSASGLAKKAGLDPTTFNKSKRISPDGRQRWPSTESIAKALDATGTPLDLFIGLVAQSVDGARRPVRLIGFAQAAQNGFFDHNGIPRGTGWDEIAFPALDDENAYALEVSGDDLLPLYRDGDRIILSPKAQIRRGDRVVLKTATGEIIAGELKRRTAKVVELRPLGGDGADHSLDMSQISWMARIIWATQ